jgi:molybdopterin/thiamine biosynthesis adenylyltransferase
MMESLWVMSILMIWETQEIGKITMTTDEAMQKVLEGERYKRQTLLWGEEGQQKLKNARVSIIGLGHQGITAALCMTALGVGNITLIDGSKVENDQFLDMKVENGNRAEKYPDLLKRINGQINVDSYTTNLETTVDQLALQGSSVIVDATNSSRSKELALRYGREKDIPVLSTSSKFGYTKLVLFNQTNVDETLMPMFDGHPQDYLMGLVMSGLITEEVRKLVFNEKDMFLKEQLRYQMGKGSRFGFPKEEIPQIDPAKYAGLSVAFLGGGGLTTWGILPAIALGFKRADVYDYDIFESHNINRQIWGYDGIGKKKSLHTAEKIVAASGGKTASTGYDMMIEPGFNPETKYDLVFDFVDNRYTRAINTAYAVSHGIPMISAGALPYSARWDVHVPEKTNCLDCMIGIYEEGRREEMVRRASCAANPNPSVVMSNAIGAICGVMDSLSIFEPESFGEPFNGQQLYRSGNAKRFGTSPMYGACDCHHKPVPDLMITEDDVKDFAEKHPEALRVQEEVQV